ncbi:glycosyltransferase family 2 protein [Antribacter gilvus]|uniref:glycosyltransferase family 2 protein n=1 Tax=Antribacter gilvus TaxID=2304675 RepID=UPI000F79F8D2|nr:glycosyltransferase family 2 protein [Antribacter gilvus]
MEGHPPRASVVIPAHDEAETIGTLLGVLTAAAPGELEVVVACNGCTDDTARVAAGFGVTVVEVAEASKIAALNAGDAAATVFPRVYLDADVSVTLAALRAVVAALRRGELAAAPLPVMDTTGCGPLVRAYFALFDRLGYVRHSVLGAGFYALSAEGRRRFGAFPDVVADDGFVYSLFTAAERHNPPGAMFVVRPPRTLAALWRRQVRIAYGNVELEARGHSVAAPGPTWVGVVRARPWLAPAAVVYAAVNGSAKAAARRRLRSGLVAGWNRDETSRAAARTVTP